MKKVLLLNFNVLIAILIACQPVGQSTGPQMLKSGDQIDGMLITTGTSEAPPLGAFCSPALENDGTTTMDCQVPPLPKLAIGHIFGLADQALQTLDWSALLGNCTWMDIHWTWSLSVYITMLCQIWRHTRLPFGKSSGR